MSPAADIIILAALLGATAGAIYATDESDAAPEHQGIQIIHTERDGCQQVRTDAGWVPRLRRDGTQFCEAPR